ncbi:MAG: UDP-glucose 6-dehydrogenase, partial [Planctomycetes bacterium]|nr:UDP-glucose 6-dehydrogenase [Planctomycetota bacterium]
MRIAIFGTGYVGLVTGTCFAEMGNEVVCIDVDAGKIDRLRRGEIPIYEPGLGELVEDNVRHHRLSFTTDAAVGLRGADAAFICVGTPMSDDGQADLRYVEAAARDIGRRLERGFPLAVQHIHRTHGNAVGARIAHQLRRRVKAHGLAVE